MEKLNIIHPASGELPASAMVDQAEKEKSSSLLNKIHQNFKFFGIVSLIFGGGFAFWFYKAGIGLNSLAFTLIMVGLLIFASKKLEQPVVNEVKIYYIFAILLSLSSMLTASPQLQFLNTIGILMLLDVSLIRQYSNNKRMEFIDYLKRMFLLPFLSIASLGMPFTDMNVYMKKSRIFKNDKVRNILIGTVIAIPVLILVIALLSSADLLFGKLMMKFQHMLLSSDPFSVILMTASGFLACYSILCGAIRKYKDTDVKAKADPGIALTAVSLLFAVYALFCAIQIGYLFAGGLFELPEGFTYAQYARRGFFELLAVTCLNLIIILVCTHAFGESRILKGMLTAVSVCTYIMIASAAYRMLLYIGTYHLTFLRLFVLLFLLIDALILAGVILSVHKREFPLFRYSVIVVSVCYLLFSFAKPDYLIARYLLDHVQQPDYEDVTFLINDLSLDAAPVVIPGLYEMGDQSLYYYKENAPSLYNTSKIEEQVKYKVDVKAMIFNYFDRIKAKSSKRDFRDFNLSLYIAEREAFTP